MKTRIAVIFGGTNTEHEVSLVSAKAIVSNLDPNKYDVIPIKITKNNLWVSNKEIAGTYQPVIADHLVTAEKSLDSIDDVIEDQKIDLVFPVLHGPYGEDGTIQGMLELMRLPYVGCGVTASAVCMDKVLQKNVCESYGIPVAPYSWFTKHEWLIDQTQVLSTIHEKLGQDYPFFVKPVNQGSSVGVTKAHNSQELVDGIKIALTRDIKVIVEKGISNTREIECAILGRGDNPQASVLGEVVAAGEFYDFESKYLDQGSKSLIPAPIESNLTDSIRETAKLAFKVLDCYGLARIDFLLDSKTNKYYLNELNTLPGFTPISMYPKLWEASGLSYPLLLDRLIELALARHQEKSDINLSR